MFSWVIEADIDRLKKTIAEATDQANRRSLEAQLRHKEGYLSKAIAREYRSAFTN